jgi:SNF2 family DNA or RNA helicase
MDFAKISQHYKNVSYYSPPSNFTIEEWQYALRKQYAENHPFRIDNMGIHSVFSDFNVHNPSTGLFYKVAIRSKDNSANFCECSDFKTNGLGTCKHIEAVLYYIDKKLNKGHLLEIGFQPVYTSIFLDYRNDRKVRIRIGYDNADLFKKLASEYFDSDFVLKPGSYVVFDEIVKQGKNINDNFRCYPDALLHVIEQREYIKRDVIIKEKYLNTKDEDVYKELVNANLYNYQKEGICFAASKGRCIIADDMGLGKTIQAIVAAEILRKESGIASVFIICPTSLKFQWKSEIEKFTGQQALVIEGNPAKRINQYQAEAFYKITSYNAVVNDIDEINAIAPDLIILDEAQRIKNFRSKISTYIKRLKSPYTFVLTGTPLENKLEELYSIVQFVNPYKLGPFWRFIHEHRIVDEKGKIAGYKDLNRIGELLQDIMVRRRKRDVLAQLPERIDKILYVPMTEEQAAIHDEYRDIVARIINKWQRQGFLKENDRQQLMNSLNTMRMVCDSTYIVDQKTRFDTKVNELMNILEEVLTEDAEKIVIFSQWERMTRLVSAELTSRGINYQYLHGGVPGSERGKLYDTFNNNQACKVFLSTDAGSLGLNLQSASILVNLDIPWNPALLEQRIARIHRLGQNHKVSIINMVSVNTIEHRMLKTLSFKKGLSEGILDQGDNTIFLEESKFNIFMKAVEDILESPETPDITPQKYTELSEDVVPVHPNYSETIKIGNSEDKNTETTSPSFLGDDDIAATNEELATSGNDKNTPEEIIRMGISFLSQLGATLSDPEAKEKLLSTLVQTDETEGKTYLKIPVEDKKVVENVLTLIAGLLGEIKK